MKQLYFFALIAVTASFSLNCMNVNHEGFQHAREQEYPEGIGYLPIKKVLECLPPIPPNHNENVQDFLSKNPIVKQLCQLPPISSPYDFIHHCVEQKDHAKKLGNMSKTNIALKIKESVIKIASSTSRIRNNISSLGYDPYVTTWVENPELIEAAALFKPTMQHITGAIGQHVLGNSNSKVIEKLPTWLYHLKDKPKDLDDSNYLVVQEAIPATFSQFSKLQFSQKIQFIKKLDLAEFYTAIKYGQVWDPSEDNLWVNTENGKIMLPDTESPDNEGLGIKVKFNKAILGQSLHKAKHNIRNPWDGGHKIFEQIVTKYGDPEEVELWDVLYQSDNTVQ